MVSVLTRSPMPQYPLHYMDAFHKYLAIRLPTERKLQQCDYIELTSDAEWDPYSSRFSEQERPYLLTPTRSIQQNNRFQSATSSMDHRYSSVDALTLAGRWGITIERFCN